MLGSANYEFFKKKLIIYKFGTCKKKKKKVSLVKFSYFRQCRINDVWNLT